MVEETDNMDHYYIWLHVAIDNVSVLSSTYERLSSADQQSSSSSTHDAAAASTALQN